MRVPVENERDVYKGRGRQQWGCAHPQQCKLVWGSTFSEEQWAGERKKMLINPQKSALRDSSK